MCLADVVPVADISVDISVTMVVVSFSVVGVSTMVVVGGDGGVVPLAVVVVRSVVCSADVVTVVDISVEVSVTMVVVS